MVEAKGLNNKYFGYPSNEEVPDNILTTGDSTAPFVAIGVQGITAKGLKIYKVRLKMDCVLEYNSTYNVNIHCVL